MEKYVVTLNAEERSQLEALVSKGTHAAQKVLTALILLNCDASKDRAKRRGSEEIAQVLHISARKVDRVKRCFVEEGLEAVLSRQPSQRVYTSIIDADVEAHLIALSCGEPPKGHARWSLKLLADKAVELEYVESISRETVRRTLKKTNSNPGKRWAG
jgi:hypothetical protein